MLTFYPSPAGATESLLALDAWRDGPGASALAQVLEPDVEALLVCQRPRRSARFSAFSGTQPADGCGVDHAGEECLLVPIDACYELVGLVRTHWRGFDGGAELWAQVGEFVARLRDRARELTCPS
jgi:hypothetical protein